MEELAQRFINLCLEMDAIQDELSDKDPIEFLRLVSEKMRQQGIAEERIQGMLSGASWGQKHWDAFKGIILSYPSILAGSHQGQTE